MCNLSADNMPSRSPSSASRRRHPTSRKTHESSVVHTPNPVGETPTGATGTVALPGIRTLSRFGAFCSIFTLYFPLQKPRFWDPPDGTRPATGGRTEHKKGRSAFAFLGGKFLAGKTGTGMIGRIHNFRESAMAAPAAAESFSSHYGTTGQKPTTHRGDDF